MLIQKSCSRPSRVHQVHRRAATSAGLGMKIFWTHPLVESSHHATSGTTNPATANTQYHRREMLPRKVHSELCVFCAGGMLRGIGMDGAARATLMGAFAAARPAKLRSTTSRGPFCSWLERAPGENLTAISRAFVPPWSLIEDETGQLSDQTLQRSRNPSSPEDSVRKSPRLSGYHRLQKACHSVRALQSHDTTIDCGSLSGIRARARQPQNRAER